MLRMRCCGVASTVVGVLLVGTEPAGRWLELWNWTLGVGDQHVSEGHEAGTKS